jgi:putative ABC transport system permease protein
MELVDIGYGELALCFLVVVAAGIASLKLHLGLEREIAWATLRMTAQLVLMGYLLRIIFGIGSAWLVLLVLGGMIFFAARIVTGRTAEKQVALFWPTFFTMLLSYMVITVFATAAIVRVDPWYAPQYVIPIGGMVVGNSMNAIALALERFFASLRQGRTRVELCLSLGATAEEASAFGVREAVRAAMIPTINSMFAIGLVFLPGMMTGQILAGADPLVAIRYQIMIMLLILGSTLLGSILILRIVGRLCFTRADQIRI